MFQKLANSWELVKASWAVLRADKELLFFPLISFIGVVLVSLPFLFAGLATGVFESAAGEGEGSFPPIGYVLLFFYYVATYTVIFFFNTALVGAAMKRMDGGDPTFRDGLDIAMKHLGNILAYAVIASTVGIILNYLRDKGWLGKIAAGFIGLAWNIATFLVVPVLVVEEVGPIEAIKRSSSLLRQTWGEQIAGNFGIGTVFGLLFVVVIILAIPVVGIGIAIGPVGVVITVGLVVLVLAGLALVQSALSGIYTAAVYRYATAGQVEFFQPELIQGAFKQK